MPQTLDLALKEMPRKNRQAFLRTLKVIEFYWPPCCAFIVDMYKRAREYVYFGSQTWGGEPNPDYNPDLAAQLLIGYTRLFKDLLEDLKGKAKSTAVAMILDATNPIEFVELSQLRVNAAAYWSPRSQAVNWVKMLENDPELTFTAVFHMVGVISRGSEGVFPPGYGETRMTVAAGRWPWICSYHQGLLRDQWHMQHSEMIVQRTQPGHSTAYTNHSGAQRTLVSALLQLHHPVVHVILTHSNSPLHLCREHRVAGRQREAAGSGAAAVLCALLWGHHGQQGARGAAHGSQGQPGDHVQSPSAGADPELHGEGYGGEQQQQPEAVGSGWCQQCACTVTKCHVLRCPVSACRHVRHTQHSSLPGRHCTLIGGYMTVLFGVHASSPLC